MHLHAAVRAVCRWRRLATRQHWAFTSWFVTGCTLTVVDWRNDSIVYRLDSTFSSTRKRKNQPISKNKTLKERKKETHQLKLGRRWSRVYRWTCYRCNCPYPTRWRPWSLVYCASGCRSPFRLWLRHASAESSTACRCGTRRRNPVGLDSVCACACVCVCVCVCIEHRRVEKERKETKMSQDRSTCTLQNHYRIETTTRQKGEWVVQWMCVCVTHTQTHTQVSQTI